MSALAIATVQHARNTTTATHKVTFDELAALLADVKKGKKDGNGWLPVTLSKQQRHGDNVETVNYLVIDVEADAEKVKGDDGKALLDEFGDEVKRVVGIDPPDVEAITASIEIMHGWLAIVHTSYSHSIEHPRYRIVVALTRPMLPHELKAVGTWAVDQLGLNDCYDSGALEPARFFYLPRCPSDDRLALFQCVTIEGDPLDVDAVLDAANSAPLLAANEPSNTAPPVTAQAMSEPSSSTYQGDDDHLLDDLRSALEFICNDGRVEWIAVGHCLKTLGMDGFRLWLEWSQRSNKWQPDDVQLWHGFKTNRTGYQSVFNKAKANGWINPATDRARARNVDQIRPEELQRIANEKQRLHGMGFRQGDDGNWTDPEGYPYEPRDLKPRIHPLSITVDLAAQVMPPKWIIPHFVAEGIALIAGGHGVGKTTALLPLAMAAAGIHETDYPLAPKHWRHVVYITEDVNQAKLIINGYMRAIGGDHAELVDRVHIVEALRMPASFVVAIGDHYRENYTRKVSTTAGDVDLLPLVVIDTMAATFQLENENDNAEASTLIAALKQQFKLPLWIVGHVSKGDLSKDGLNGLNPSLRGASAFEADANQVLYLTKEKDGSRWLVRGKSRFESQWHELQIETDSQTYTVQNQFGDYEQLTQRWGIARPQEKTRTEMAAEQQEKAKEAESERLGRSMLDYVARAEAQGIPINRTELHGMVGGNKQNNTDTINKLLDQKWLYEVLIPQGQRAQAKREKYLVSLTHGERDEYLATGTPPAHKLEIYESWKKPEKVDKEK